MSDDTHDQEHIESMLEPLFAGIRDESPELPPDLASRILADAEQVQVQFRAHLKTQSRIRRFGTLAQAIKTLGGWGTMGGLATAGFAGVWLGLSLPAISSDPVGRFLESRIEPDILDPGSFFVPESEEFQ